MKRTPPHIWTTYQYFDSREVLVKLGAIENALVGVQIDKPVLELRTHALRPYNERRQAALFLYGLSCLFERPIEYAAREEEDFDCIARWNDGDSTNYTPVQLKELPPADINSTATLQSEIEKLSKYATSTDLCVAYYLNREMHIDLSELRLPKLSIAELWLFGGVSADGMHWMLWGNLLDAPRGFRYGYPA